MMEMENQKIEVNFLAHHGVTGQKWGERRYQNKDGSLTPLGRIHWGIGQARNAVSNKLKTRKSFRLETDSEKRKRLKLKAEKKEENKKLKLQKAEEVRQKREKAIEDKKAKIIAKGDKDAIYKNRELFSDEELDKAIARINKVNQFKTEKSSKQVEHLINRATPKEVYKNRAMLNDDELDRALNRISKLEKIKPEDKKTLESLKQTKENRQTAKDGKITLDKIASTGKTLVGIAGTAIGAYEAYNKIAANVNEIAGYEKLPVFKIQPWEHLMPKKDKSDSDKNNDNSGSGKNKQNKGDDTDNSNSSGGNNKPPKGPKSGPDGTAYSTTKNNGYSTVNDKLDVNFGGKKSNWSTSTASTGDWASNATVTTGKHGLFNKTKAPNMFDFDSGYQSAKELKQIAKGKGEAAESANIWYSTYSAGNKASKTSFADLVKSSVTEEYTGNTGYSGYYVSPKSWGDYVPTVTWEKKITDVKPITFEVSATKNLLAQSGGTKISTIWEDTGAYDVSDIAKKATMYAKRPDWQRGLN